MSWLQKILDLGHQSWVSQLMNPARDLTWGRKKEEASRTRGAIEKKNKTKPSPKKDPFPKSAQAPAEDADHERNPWIMSQDVRRMIYLLPNL